MLTATHPLGAVVSPSRHGPPSSSSSFPSSTASPAGQWAPRRAAATVLPSKVSCTRVSVSEVVNNDPAVGTVDYETLSATLTVRMDEGWSTPENVADMAHRPWLFLKFVSSEFFFLTQSARSWIQVSLGTNQSSLISWWTYMAGSSTVARTVRVLSSAHPPS